MSLSWTNSFMNLAPDAHISLLPVCDVFPIHLLNFFLNNSFCPHFQILYYKLVGLHPYMMHHMAPPLGHAVIVVILTAVTAHTRNLPSFLTTCFALISCPPQHHRSPGPAAPPAHSLTSRFTSWSDYITPRICQKSEPPTPFGTRFQILFHHVSHIKKKKKKKSGP